MPESGDGRCCWHERGRAPRRDSPQPLDERPPQLALGGTPRHHADMPRRRRCQRGIAQAREDGLRRGRRHDPVMARDREEHWRVQPLRGHLDPAEATGRAPIKLAPYQSADTPGQPGRPAVHRRSANPRPRRKHAPLDARAAGRQSAHTWLRLPADRATREALQHIHGRAAQGRDRGRKLRSGGDRWWGAPIPGVEVPRHRQQRQAREIALTRRRQARGQQPTQAVADQHRPLPERIDGGIERTLRSPEDLLRQRQAEFGPFRPPSPEARGENLMWLGAPAVTARARGRVSRPD